jgi:hypothetical protein
MEQVITLVCKLPPTPEQAHHLDETLTRFAEACTYIVAGAKFATAEIFRP